MSQGKLYIISAASGTGKTSLINELIAKTPNVKMSISYTTRKKRADEKKDVDYHFITKEAFEALIQQNELLEYAVVFDHCYGTSKKDTERDLANGINLILEIDVQGAEQIRKKMNDVISIFILPPSMEALRKRIYGRAQDDPKVMEKRLKKAKDEISKAKDFDCFVVNDEFGQAVKDLETIFKKGKVVCQQRHKQQEHLIDTLLK